MWVSMEGVLLAILLLITQNRMSQQTDRPRPGDHRLDRAVKWIRDLGVRYVRTGLSWADSLRPDAQRWSDRQMRALEPFEVTVTFCFTPESEGVRADHTSPPRDVARFADFCAEQVRRYA